MPDFLLELFSEEIPARMQTRAADDLKRLVTEAAVEAGLTYRSAAGFATARRLTLAIEGLDTESKPKREERKGPRVDAPDKALDGFLRSTGLTKDQLEQRDDKKGAVWFAVIDSPGRAAADILAEALPDVIAKFPWPKSMRWGDGPMRWVRPLHSILAILYDEAGAAVVPFEAGGIQSGDRTDGHRFLAPGSIQVTSFDDYEAKLARAHVVLRAEARRDHIWADATSAAFAKGREVVEDPGLLAEVAGLVEWPVVHLGDIAPDFLDLPPEVLQTSMKEHQKFLSVKDPKSGKIDGFVVVANTETADQGATILAGNRKVLAARLSDAKFFWENDLRVAKAGMGDWLASLENVTFHAKLGTVADRVDRIAALARELAPMVGADPDLAERAAKVAKADLASEMVYEFPELQGIMGRYYAAEAGLPDEVAAAAEEHYAPLGPSDDVPTAPVSVAVALAEKIDVLTGFWAIDEKPTGSKDPFALRRAALGVIRIILEGKLRLLALEAMTSQFELSDASVGGATIRSNETLGEEYRKKTGAATIQGHPVAIRVYDKIGDRDVDKRSIDLLAFLHDRLKVYLRDRGIRHDVIDACLAMPGSDDLTLLVKRAEALQATLATEDGENLVQGFKRANNILTQAEEVDGVEYSYGADAKFAENDAEKALFAALDAADAKIGPAMEAEDFAAAMTAMAALRGPIDAFFDAVQINTENQVLRRNRLNLLSRIRETCGRVADLTRLQG